MDKTVQRYLRRVRRGLACPQEDREALMVRAGTMLEDFTQENPGAFYKDYVDSFGPPELFAETMLADVDPEEVTKARKRQKYIRWGALAALFAVVLAVSLYWYAKWHKAQEVIRGDFYVVETIEPISYEEATERIEKIREERQSDSGG